MTRPRSLDSAREVPHPYASGEKNHVNIKTMRQRPTALKKTYVMRGLATERALDVYHLIYAPTHACNLRCRHCYLPDHAAGHAPLERVKTLIDAWERVVVRDRGPRGGYFHLKGGEPLILPYLIDVLDLLAEKATLRFMMTTNGTTLRPGLVDSLSRLDDAVGGDVIVIVSLDGSREEVHRVLRGAGHFAASERFARVLIEADLNVHFNYVVHSGNIDDVPDFVAFAERVGATQINFLPLVPKGFGAAMGLAGVPDPEALHGILSQLYRDGTRVVVASCRAITPTSSTWRGRGSARRASAWRVTRGCFTSPPRGRVFMPQPRRGRASGRELRGDAAGRDP